MKVLVTGGAGYIGSHMVRHLQNNGHEVVVIDDFSTGHRWAVKSCEVAELNLLDNEKLATFFQHKAIDCVVHFAAKSLVGESIKFPDLYYQNNFIGSYNLINQMLKNDIENLVFSSTAAIFGNPTVSKIKEEQPVNPINPYGRSKLMVETMLKDICDSHRLNAVCFRYFNAAGADTTEPDFIGECHDPETHLIPNILKSVLSGSPMEIYGSDYNTHDGTCVRDYVHVNDLAQAHLLGLEYLKGNDNRGFSAFNLGNGSGFSVLDVIKACEKVIGRSVDYTIEKRRLGDPDMLVADSTYAIKKMNWRPRHSSLELIINSAWQWHKRLASKKMRLLV